MPANLLTAAAATLAALVDVGATLVDLQQVPTGAEPRSAPDVGDRRGVDAGVAVLEVVAQVEGVATAVECEAEKALLTVGAHDREIGRAHV